jgi:CRP-like cAMP-binding protein
MQTKHHQESLKGSEFFKKMASEEIEKIAHICQAVTLNKGDYLFRQGEVGDHLYIITKGQIVLERDINIGTRKGKVIIETLGKGRVLGCWSTLLGEPHRLMSSAHCQRQADVLTLKGSELRHIMTTNPTLGFNLLERLCFLLRDRIQAAYGALEKI